MTVDLWARRMEKNGGGEVEKREKEMEKRCKRNRRGSLELKKRRREDTERGGVECKAKDFRGDIRTRKYKSIH